MESRTACVIIDPPAHGNDSARVIGAYRTKSEAIELILNLEIFASTQEATRSDLEEHGYCFWEDDGGMPTQFNLEILQYEVPAGTDPNSIVVMEESNYRWGNGAESYYAAPTKAAFIPQIWLQIAPFEPRITLAELVSKPSSPPLISLMEVITARLRNWIRARVN